VVISTAHGLKFAEFKIGYHQAQLASFDVDPTYANLPVELPAEYGPVRDRIFRTLDLNGG
jgi:threonine synthase